MSKKIPFGVTGTANILAGQIKTFDEITAFRPPYDLPCVITECRVVEDSYANAEIQQGSYNGLLYSKLGLRVGTEFLTPPERAYVLNLGKKGFLWSVGTNLTRIGHMDWKFKQGMFVPQGVRLFADIYNTHSVDTTVHVGLFGYAIEELDARVSMSKVPYVSTWKALSTATGTEVKSTKMELVNPFRTPMFITALQGFSLNSSGVGLGATVQIADWYDYVRIFREDGQAIVPKDTPANHVFCGENFWWDVDFVLQPGEAIYMWLNDDVAAAYSKFAIHGYREVDINNM